MSASDYSENEVPANCSDVLGAMWDYLDGELSADDAQILIKHIEQCLPCARNQEQAEALKGLMVSAATTTCPKELRERVRALVIEAFPA